MAFKKPTINKVKTDIQSLTIYLRSVKKWGKSTLFRDLILEKYGDAEKGLLIGVGAEAGYNILDNLNVTQVESWKDMKELKKWLIAEKGKEHDIKMIAFDVVEEIIPLAEEEVIRMSNLDKKPCSTFNGAYGGFGEPRKKLQKLIKEYFVDLRKAGFGIICIGHTKVKNIKEKGDETEGYNILTSTLSNDNESLFADIFDCVLTGTIEKTIDSKRITGEERRLFLRGNSYVDAGCRFAPDAVPEYIVYEGNFAKTLIDTLEEGLRLSASKPTTKKEFEKEQKKEVKALEDIKLEVKEEVEELNKAEVINNLKTNMQRVDMDKLKKAMAQHGVTSFANPDILSNEFLIEVNNILKSIE